MSLGDVLVTLHNGLENNTQAQRVAPGNPLVVGFPDRDDAPAVFYRVLTDDRSFAETAGRFRSVETERVPGELDPANHPYDIGKLYAYVFQATFTFRVFADPRLHPATDFRKTVHGIQRDFYRWLLTSGVRDLRDALCEPKQLTDGQDVGFDDLFEPPTEEEIFDIWSFDLIANVEDSWTDVVPNIEQAVAEGRVLAPDGTELLTATATETADYL